MLGIFEKLKVMVDSSNVEDCHRVKSQKKSKGPKEVLVKFSSRKDAKNTKKGLAGMNLISLCINSMLFRDFTQTFVGFFKGNKAFGLH